MVMRHAVSAIPGEPLPHGLLGSCARVEDVPEDRVHELMGIDWLALGCCPVLDWVDPCLSDESPGESPGQAEKEFCRPTVEHADPITIYAGAECSAPGWSWAEAREHARASLELGEQQALEAAVWRQLAERAVDLTPEAGPVSVAQGVAALEGCLGESYGGRGVLHIPTGVAALLGCCNILRESEPGLQTWAGNCAVIGAGYSRENTGPDGEPAEPGTAWLYISGPVEIRRGPVVMVPDEHRQAVNTRTNDLRVLAERTYVVGTTCTVCAIQVTTC